MEWLRARPWWQQVLVWVFLWWVLLLVLLWRSGLDLRVKVGITAAAVLVVAVAGILDESEEPAPVGVQSATTVAAKGSTTIAAAPATTATSEKHRTTERPTTTTTAAPPARSQQEVVSDAVAEALGKSNRDYSPRVTVTANPGLGVVVTWAINENLTSGLTKDTARLEGTEILKAVRDSATDYSGVAVEGTFPLQDQYGNASEERVVLARYSRATLARFNFDNFYFKRVFDDHVADSVWLHPAFQY